jgi:hypothetical protein
MSFGSQSACGEPAPTSAPAAGSLFLHPLPAAQANAAATIHGRTRDPERIHSSSMPRSSSPAGCANSIAPPP